MMEEYEFRESSSSTVDRDGEQHRKINFRGIDPERELNVDGYIKVPVMEYFQAGIDGKIPDLIREKVVDKLTANAE